jgi:hypothetical protein
MLNIQRLQKELAEAGISISGCNSNGVVWDIDGSTEIQSRPDVSAIIAAHDPDDRWDKIRSDRNLRLSTCDWTQLPDAALAGDERKAWAEYRQALRNLPQTYSNPNDVIWPVMP